jgi:lipopolysaccharide transport system permease protein
MIGQRWYPRTRGRDDGSQTMSPNVTISPRRGVEQTLRHRLAILFPLLWLWTLRDLRTRYRQSVLQGGWGLVQPVLLLLTYGWVFTAVLDIGPEAGVPYLSFAWAGLGPFMFFAQSLGQGVGSIQQAAPLISRVWFPREVLPLAVVGSASVDFLVMAAVLVGITWVQVGPPSIHLLGLVPVYAMLALWTVGLALVSASVTVYRRDLNHAMPLALRLLFIVTPVMYSADLIEAQVPGFTAVNPLAVAIEGTRDVAYRDAWPDWTLLGAQALAGLVVALLAFVVFRRLEPRMGDVA